MQRRRVPRQQRTRRQQAIRNISVGRRMMIAFSAARRPYKYPIRRKPISTHSVSFDLTTHLCPPDGLQFITEHRLVLLLGLLRYYYY